MLSVLLGERFAQVDLGRRRARERESEQATAAEVKIDRDRRERGREKEFGPKRAVLRRFV